MRLRNRYRRYRRYRPSTAAMAALAGDTRRKRKTFQCSGFGSCHMQFSRNEHLARHIRKHTGERPFKCFCGRTFSRLDNLRQHAQTVHTGDDVVSPYGSVSTMPAKASKDQTVTTEAAEKATIVVEAQETPEADHQERAWGGIEEGRERKEKKDLKEGYTGGIMQKQAETRLLSTGKRRQSADVKDTVHISNECGGEAEETEKTGDNAETEDKIIHKVIDKTGKMDTENIVDTEEKREKRKKGERRECVREINTAEEENKELRRIDTLGTVDALEAAASITILMDYGVQQAKMVSLDKHKPRLREDAQKMSIQFLCNPNIGMGGMDILAEVAKIMN
ncbi:uncharacterized protein T551_02372 [Pneumocystis jirovecii RU7]|uniref:C2H2-type domain-containing protein n=1 Tax=Pneumocystis jirovecii (strain RU7) TaxID=1408657 RepID=A0A0W4ZL43_PNEJ7|nr:uncharacterized protein T551_02372 [Pneumocystis jirovecii RU7]KTW29098.1 hypothetical protein T551_02372 [Pneumocystis jirovecii RU7]